MNSLLQRSGVFCLLAALGQVLNHAPLTMLGIAAWGPGVIILLVLFARWFRWEVRS